MRRRRPVLMSCSALALTVLSACSGVDDGSQSDVIETAGYSFQDITLTGANDRAVPVRVFRPDADCSPCDLIIFSHGALATYDRYDVLLTDWAKRGYVVVAPQHVDSEEHPARDAFQKADSQSLRVEDYYVASEEFGKDGFAFDGLTFSGKQFATGHSYGALIALVAGGAELEVSLTTIPNKVIDPVAVIAISPPGEMEGRANKAGYSKVDEPLLVITGTTDVLPGFIDEWTMHLASYEASQPGIGYALIFENMDHYFNGAFGRIKPEGALAQPAIDTLNTQIAAFLNAASQNKAPAGPDWEQPNNPMVRTLQK